MASEIRGFTDPGSMQAFGNLLQGEQLRDQMAFAAGQQGQQLGLAQQQMAQEAELAQQRMAQGQQQFEAGLLENQRAREFATSERMAEQKFQADQMAAWQKWEQAKANELRSFDLRLEELRLLAEKARASNNKAALDAINAEQDELETKQAEAAFRVGFAQSTLGKSEEDISRIFSELASRIEKEAAVRENAVAVGDSRASELASVLSRAERSASAGKLQALTAAQVAAASPSLGTLAFESIVDALGIGAGSELQAAEMAGIGGVEFLNMRPGTSLGGLSWRSTPAGSLIESEMDSDAMSRMVKERTHAAVGDVMAGLGGDKAGVASALQKIDGGDIQGGMQALVAAKVDPYTLRAMLRRYSTDLANGRADRLNAIAAAKSEDRGQRSLRTAALEAAERANETKISYLDRMVTSLPVADPSKMKLAISAAGRMLQTRQLIGSDVAMVREALPGVDFAPIEAGLLSQQRAADALKSAFQEQGLLQARQNRLGRRAAMVPFAGESAAIDEQLRALGGLMP